MAKVTADDQRAQFAARVGRIHHGGPMTLGQQHAGMNADGTTRTFGGTVKRAGGHRRGGLLKNGTIAFAIGIAAAFIGQRFVDYLGAMESPQVSQVLLEMSEAGALQHLPLAAALLISFSMIIVAGLRGRLVMVTVVLGIFALPVLQGAEIDPNALTSLAANQMSVVLPVG